jgi:hypothetical protein
LPEGPRAILPRVRMAGARWKTGRKHAVGGSLKARRDRTAIAGGSGFGTYVPKCRPSDQAVRRDGKVTDGGIEPRPAPPSAAPEKPGGDESRP